MRRISKLTPKEINELTQQFVKEHCKDCKVQIWCQALSCEPSEFTDEIKHWITSCPQFFLWLNPECTTWSKIATIKRGYDTNKSITWKKSKKK